MSLGPTLPPKAFSARERDEVNLLLVAVIAAMAITVVIQGLMSQQPLTQKILLAALGGGLATIAFLFIYIATEHAESAWLQKLQEGTL